MSNQANPRLRIIVFRRDDQVWLIPETNVQRRRLIIGSALRRDTLDPVVSALPINLESARLNAMPVTLEEARDVIRRVNSRYDLALIAVQLPEEN